MFETIRYYLEKRRGMRAGKKISSVDQAIKDYERFRFGYMESAIRAGKTLHIQQTDGKIYKVIHEEAGRSCYDIPKPDIIESVDGDDKGTQYEVRHLGGRRFYK